MKKGAIYSIPKSILNRIWQNPVRYNVGLKSKAILMLLILIFSASIPCHNNFKSFYSFKKALKKTQNSFPLPRY